MRRAQPGRLAHLAERAQRAQHAQTKYAARRAAVIRAAASTAILTALPLRALAAWGENWGEMSWGGAAPMVPALGAWALRVLVLLLVLGGAAWMRAPRARIEPQSEEMER